MINLKQLALNPSNSRTVTCQHHSSSFMVRTCNLFIHGHTAFNEFFEVESIKPGTGSHWGEWPSGLYSLRQVTEVRLGRVRSDSGWVTTET